MRFFLVFFLSVLIKAYVFASTVYFIPPKGHSPAHVFLDPYAARDETAKPFFCLKEAVEKAGYQIAFTQDGKGLQDIAAIICFDQISVELLESLSAYPQEKCLLFALEPPVVAKKSYGKKWADVFGKIFVLLEDIVDGETYLKFYYPQPRQKMLESLPAFKDKKLCALIASNRKSKHPQALYAERKRVIQFFQALKTDEFDLYGPRWDKKRAWKGMVPSKWETLKNYKFSFCYENMHSQRGYITEKIFDSMVAGCVPIYLGASDITDYVPAECFIDRRKFASYKDLYHFLRGMDQERYEGYLRSIQAYLESPQSKLFSIEYFVDLVLQHLSSIKGEEI